VAAAFLHPVCYSRIDLSLADQAERGQVAECIAPQISEAVGYIRKRVSLRPLVGLVLGSGFGELSAELRDATALAARDIPHFPVPTVEGHLGQLAFGTIEGVPVAILQGRPHFYEGYEMWRAALHVWVLKQLGCHALILTNAAGALNPYFWPGDLMLITDHINLPGLAGHNPLFGVQCTEFGPRFVDMGNAYDSDLSELASRVAQSQRLELRRGVYVMVGGPSYETQAELRFLRLIGGDAVGMSTANEVVAARQCGLRVLGLSGITNVAIQARPGPLSHEEVLAVGEVLRPKVRELLRGMLRRINEWPFCIGSSLS